VSPERWKQIQNVFAAAQVRQVGERAAFFHDACVGDAELRREIEWMLEH